MFFSDFPVFCFFLFFFFFWLLLFFFGLFFFFFSNEKVEPNQYHTLCQHKALGPNPGETWQWGEMRPWRRGDGGGQTAKNTPVESWIERRKVHSKISSFFKFKLWIFWVRFPSKKPQPRVSEWTKRSYIQKHPWFWSFAESTWRRNVLEWRPPFRWTVLWFKVRLWEVFWSGQERENTREANGKIKLPENETQKILLCRTHNTRTRSAKKKTKNKKAKSRQKNQPNKQTKTKNKKKQQQTNKQKIHNKFSNSFCACSWPDIAGTGHPDIMSLPCLWWHSVNFRSPVKNWCHFWSRAVMKSRQKSFRQLLIAPKIVRVHKKLLNHTCISVGLLVCGPLHLQTEPPHSSCWMRPFEILPPPPRAPFAEACHPSRKCQCHPCDLSRPYRYLPLNPSKILSNLPKSNS